MSFLLIIVTFRTAYPTMMKESSLLEIAGDFAYGIMAFA